MPGNERATHRCADFPWHVFPLSRFAATVEDRHPNNSNLHINKPLLLGLEDQWKEIEPMSSGFPSLLSILLVNSLSAE